MDTSFWLKLGSSFLVGSAWVTLSTVAAERYGTKIGGLIGGLPSTVIVTLFFIGLTQTPLVAVSATTIIPLSMSCTGLFMVVYLFFARRGLRVGLAIALLIWFCLSGLLVGLDIRDVRISILGWVCLAVGCFLVVEKGMKIPSRIRVKAHYTTTQIVYRAVFGGAVITFAVLMGKLGGPLLGGIFATFPAMFLSTLVITYRVGGADFSRAVGKSLLVSGIATVPIYALAVRFLYPWAGLGLGTLLAILVSLGAGYLTFLFMRAGMS